MKRETRLLLEKGCDSVLLSIELFNRPHDRGRVSSTLILFNHAFEMLLKAAIVHRGGRIREARANQTIGFDTCVRRGLTTGEVKFLTEEQALLLQSINGLRDAAQHDLLEISEGQLYVHAQAGVTLFRDLLKSVFGQDLADYMPERVLPVSTSPPSDLTTLFDSEVEEIKKLLRPGRRRRIEAEARLRPLAILDTAIRGEKGQPSAGDLRRMGTQLASGRSWQDIFKGVSAIEITADPQALGCRSAWPRRKAFRSNWCRKVLPVLRSWQSSEWTSSAFITSALNNSRRTPASLCLRPLQSWIIWDFAATLTATRNSRSAASSTSATRQRRSTRSSRRFRTKASMRSGQE